LLIESHGRPPTMHLFLVVAGIFFPEQQNSYFARSFDLQCRCLSQTSVFTQDEFLTLLLWGFCYGLWQHKSSLLQGIFRVSVECTPGSKAPAAHQLLCFVLLTASRIPKSARQPTCPRPSIPYQHLIAKLISKWRFDSTADPEF
jgi:hypothetical protein